MSQNPTSIAIDWLQLNCTRETAIDTDYKGQYTLKANEYGTKQFKNLVEVFYQNSKVATVVFNPRSRILNAKMHLIKFENNLLYNANLYPHVLRLLGEFNLKFVSFTRIDICLDFNKFDSGLMPEYFIKQFLQCNILKLRPSKFAVHGEQDFNVMLSGLGFGDKTSEVNYYLYNKSKEMRDVKLKPWIVDNWKLNGLDTLADVWRLEFSCKAPQRNLVDFSSGLMIDLKSLELIKLDNFKVFYQALLKHYFTFKRNNNTLNKSRMKDVDLFDLSNTDFKLIPKSNKQQSNRSDKVFIKKFASVNDAKRGADIAQDLASSDRLRDYVIERDLLKWCNYKNINIY